jgi:hypothetical protein
MKIEAAPIPHAGLVEYEAVPIAFEVRSAFMANRPDGTGSFVLDEPTVEPPYIKNYDAISERPGDWARRVDTSRGTSLVARAEGRCTGGAAVALATPALELLEGRDAPALLWDIRAAPAYRGRAMEPETADHVWSVEEIVGLLEWEGVNP